MPWIQTHLTVDKSQAPLVKQLGALSVTLGNACDKLLLEPAPGDTDIDHLRAVLNGAQAHKPGRTQDRSPRRLQLEAHMAGTPHPHALRRTPVDTPRRPDTGRQPGRSNCGPRPRPGLWHGHPSYHCAMSRVAGCPSAGETRSDRFRLWLGHSRYRRTQTRCTTRRGHRP